ncbi:MAG TPA: DEAD/DEAH box helicase [Candidatus Omnitrophota bacterium]|nr:DEAD/DEAH box helicase [Candidatus Omnitrophota bacterium]
MEQNDLSFYGLGIAPKILETLKKLQFKIATPIQHKAIPVALEGKDLIGIAQTGTGKTMAFVIPALRDLAQKKSMALILVPTRELALQVEESVRKIARPFAIKSSVLIGGVPINRQIRALAQNPRVLIATPGRLIDLMQQRKVRLNRVSILVLDEADRMLDMGFAPQIEKILESVPRERQTLLFSATIPPAIVDMASSHMHFPVQVEIAPSGTTAEGVSHEVFIVQKEMKKDILARLLKQYRGAVLLFCRTKIGTQKIARMIRGMGHSAAEIHSDRTLSQRREALDGFKVGKYRVLAATDIAARGIDVAGIELVINYDIPEDAENYVHRIGRTGRAGSHGHAISLATPDQGADVRNIERIIKKTLPISRNFEGTFEQFDKPKTVFSAQRYGGRWKKTVHNHRSRR